jgi:hypothetical protein
MSQIGLALGGIGGLLGGVGGILGSLSGNRAGRQARDYAAARATEGMDRTLGLLFGSPLIGARNYAGNRPMDMTGVRLADATGGSLLSRFNRNVANAQNRGNRLLQSVRQAGARNLADFNAGTADMLDVARGSEQIADSYASGAEALIDEDAARALAAANALSMAALNARGLGGSTEVANQISNNALTTAREATRAKIGVRSERADRLLRARDQRLSLLDSRTGRRAALADQNIGREATIRSAVDDRDIQLRDAITRTLLAVMSGQVANPFIGQNTSSYYPGYSPLGSGLASLGRSVSGIGGYLAGRRRDDNNNDDDDR